MSFRKPYAALFSFVALAFCQIAFPIDSDAVIDPNRSGGEAVEDKAASSLQGVFTGDSASSGALITFIGYAVIIGALAVVVWYLFKSGFMRKPFAKGEGKLKIAETRMLGNRQFISVVEYGEQKILIGVGPGKIDYLTTLQNVSGDFPQIEDPAPEMSLGGRA